METKDWLKFTRPYDLRDRLFEFACVITHLVHYLHRKGPIPRILSEQILRSGNSAGANFEEADDGSSPADKLAKRKIVLCELKETLFRLRVRVELKKMVASLVNKASGK